MDWDHLDMYTRAFLVLDKAEKAQEAGHVAEAKRLRNVAAVLAAAVPADASTVDLDLPDDGW